MKSLAHTRPRFAQRNMTGNHAHDDLSTTAHLHEVRPREQSGSQTAAHYEFQYHQAAADSLQVLDDSQVVCVYCEWHDDYVVELATSGTLQFHQVKTRSQSQGPWSLNEFFGVPARRGNHSAEAGTGTAARTDSIFARFNDHVSKFGARCDGFIFVTDHGISKEFENLLAGAAVATGVSEIPPNATKAFSRVLASVAQSFDTVTEISFHDFLRRLIVQPAVGKLSSLEECKLIIGGRVVDVSEVELSVAEAKKIGATLVSEVRRKSQRTLTSLPTSIEALQSLKGLTLGDVLRVLSLSSAGYRELRTGGRQSVLTLSRLHRFLRRSGADQSLIEDICRLKAQWDAWWIDQRHVVEPLDFVALKKECADVLKTHALGSLTFAEVRAEVARLTVRFRPILTSTEAITENHVFGLMMSMAAEAEP
jgi:hypothetical protein